MATNHKSTVVGVFDDRAHAQLAVENLRRSGFADSQIAMFIHREVGPGRTLMQPRQHRSVESRTPE